MANGETEMLTHEDDAHTYRRRAEKLRHLASSCSSDRSRRDLEALAEQWDRLAETPDLRSGGAPQKLHGRDSPTSGPTHRDRCASRHRNRLTALVDQGARLFEVGPDARRAVPVGELQIHLERRQLLELSLPSLVVAQNTPRTSSPSAPMTAIAMSRSLSALCSPLSRLPKR